MSERLGWLRRDIVLAVQVRGAIDRSPAGTVAFCQVEGDDMAASQLFRLSSSYNALVSPAASRPTETRETESSALSAAHHHTGGSTS